MSATALQAVAAAKAEAALTSHTAIDDDAPDSEDDCELFRRGVCLAESHVARSDCSHVTLAARGLPRKKKPRIHAPDTPVPVTPAFDAIAYFGTLGPKDDTSTMMSSSSVEISRGDLVAMAQGVLPPTSGSDGFVAAFTMDIISPTMAIDKVSLLLPHCIALCIDTAVVSMKVTKVRMTRLCLARWLLCSVLRFAGLLRAVHVAALMHRR